MKVSDRLRAEHRAIGEVLAGVGLMTRQARRGGGVPWDVLSSAIDFFAGFVDRCHETKEEKALFPVLRRVNHQSFSVPRLQASHEEARGLIEALRMLAPGQPDGEVARLLDAYVALQHDHMASEDGTLLPYVDTLTPAQQARVHRGFDRVEEAIGGAVSREALLALGRAVIAACQAAAGAPAGGLRVAQVMRTDVPSVGPADSLARAAEVMSSLGARELPVMEGTRLVGILARSDLEPHRGHYEWTPVRAAMTPDPVAVGPDAPVREVAALLLERSFNSVPVLREGTLLGMVRRSDLLCLLAGTGGPLPPRPGVRPGRAG